MAISQGLFVAAVFAFTVSCLVMDVRTGRIPNWLTVPAFALGLLTHLGIAGWAGLKFSLLGFATGFGLLLVLMLIGGGGAGDVKMIGALRAWLGWELTVAVFIASAVVNVFILAGQTIDLQIRKGGKAARNGGRRKKQTTSLFFQRLPYGVYVSLAAWAVLAYAWKHGDILAMFSF